MEKAGEQREQTFLRLSRHRWAYVAIAMLLSLQGPRVFAADANPWAPIDQQISTHRTLTGVYVLERGQDALLTRAWFADHARTSIDIQYFIWSTDNIGILASAALLRAADRGVKVRVIVDDLLIDAPDKSLFALAKHPNIAIRIYNPKHSVGTPLRKRLVNVATDFRGINQRMHDKTFVVDGKVAITGGRNMADEYFDFDHHYNFRDRDALLLGAVVPQLSASFERFWASALTVPVEQLFDGLGLLQKNVVVQTDEVQQVYRELAAYAADRSNFAIDVRAAIDAIPAEFPRVAQQIRWTQVRFLSDMPGKNNSRFALDGGGQSTAELAKLLGTASSDVLIQSPYVVLSIPALKVFGQLRKRGVRIRISTNSLASTDNLQAFSGYRNQRNILLAMGIELHEFRPDPAIQRQVMQRYQQLGRGAPVFALHAKTLVLDRSTAYIGTYNLDPRSENLNTEAGAVIDDAVIAASVADAILIDMQPQNSWNADRDDPDQYASFAKRSKVRIWQFAPIKPLL